ncbi:MAG: molybdenum cofactor biosynthesis protein B [Phycisphaerae bacterium]
MSIRSHDQQHAAELKCAVITVSDTRTIETDASGTYIVDALKREGHRVMTRELVVDEPEKVRAMIERICRGGDCDVVLVTGGTGVSPRDTTFEAVSSLYEKPLPGFGELFRVLSYEEIGAAAMLSRASAGLCCQSAIFSMPGSPGAVRLAIEKLIMPQIGHIVWLLSGRT